MTVDIINKITKTYDHNNKLVKMIDEESNSGEIKYTYITYFTYYLLLTAIDKTVHWIDYDNVRNNSKKPTKYKLTFIGWLLLIFMLFGFSSALLLMLG